MASHPALFSMLASSSGSDGGHGGSFALIKALQALIQGLCALCQRLAGPMVPLQRLPQAAGSVAPPSESMLLGDHGRQWQRQNVKHGGLLDRPTCWLCTSCLESRLTLRVARIHAHDLAI